MIAEHILDIKILRELYLDMTDFWVINWVYLKLIWLIYVIFIIFLVILNPWSLSEYRSGRLYEKNEN